MAGIATGLILSADAPPGCPEAVFPGVDPCGAWGPGWGGGFQTT